MINIIKKTFLLLIVCLNIVCLPQAILAIINNIPLMSSINYSYEYIASGLRNDFVLLRYSKDIVVIILLSMMLINLYLNRKVNKYSFNVLMIALFLLVPFSTVSLMLSDEFRLGMIIAGVRIIIFPIAIICFIKNYLDLSLIKKIYKLLIRLLLLITIITLLQSIIIIFKFNTLNLAKFRLIGTFAGSGLLGLFGVGTFCFIIIYKLKIDKNVNIKLHSLESIFIIYASGTRTGMIIFCLLLFSYLYSKKVNRKQESSKVILFILLLIIIGIISLNISEIIAQRGSAIAVQFEGGRATLIFDYLSKSSVKEALIGKGIGFGTNTAISMMREFAINSTSETKVMDGTINVLITQFGLVITMSLIYMYISIIKKVLNSKLSKEMIISFIVSSLLIIVVGNVIEQFSFQLLFIINHMLIIYDYSEIEKTNI